jgi:hypothetical protein
MRCKRRLRTDYAVTDRKRAAARRMQQRQRDTVPLLAELVAETQPSIADLMATRVKHWVEWEQRDRDHRAGLWRRARRALDQHEPATRRALLDYWNGHRWLPGDPVYLLDMLHGFGRGRLVVVDGKVQPARITMPVREAIDSPETKKPLAGGWLGKRTPKSPERV